MFDSPSPQMVLPGMGGGDDPPFVPQHVPGGEGKLSHYLLFFALLPTQAAGQQAFQLGTHWRERHGLRQRVMPAERLHITLQPIVGFAEAVPRLIVDAAIQAAAGVIAACRSVPVTFDRVGSLGHKPPTALVLHCDAATTAAIASLRGLLVRSLQRRGFEAEPHRTPHMTLVYGTDHLAERVIEQPIQWTASRLVLLLSHHGLGHHEVIEQWPLPDRGTH